MLNWRDKLKSEEGMALVAVFIICIALLSFVYALGIYSFNLGSLSFRQQDRSQALYLARSVTEASIAAWIKYELSNRPEGAIQTVYYDNQGNFVLNDPAADSDPLSETVGTIDLTVSKNTDKTTTFQTTAVVDGQTEMITATTSAWADGEELAWFDPGTDRINNGPPGNVETMTVNTFFGLREIELRYHDPVFGVVECRNDSLSLPTSDNPAYIANAIFMRTALDLREWFDQQALLTVGEVLVFDHKIDVRRGLLSYGTLVLGVPDGLGIKLQRGGTALDGLYGRVYFRDDVRLNRGRYNPGQTFITGGSSFYFKQLAEGIDLVRWAEGEYAETDLVIPIPADDSNRFIPDPADLIWTVWN